MIFGPDYSVADYFATGAGVTDDRFAFVAADAASSYIVVPPGTYRISSNLTITGTLEFKPGAVLKPDFGVTVTLSGEIVAGAWQIFDGSVGGFIAGLVRNQMVLPDWWGAAPGVASDQSAKIQAAINFAQNGSRTVYLRNGLWRCDTELTITTPMSLVGDPGLSAQSVDAAGSVLDFSNAATNVNGLVVGRTTDFPLDGIVLRDFAIYRAVLPAKGTGCIGLTFKSAFQAEVTTVVVWNWDRGFTLSGTATYATAQCEFRGCRSQYAGTEHWDIWSAYDCTFDRCFGGGGTCDHLVYIYPNGGASVPNALHFTNCVFVSDSPEGVRILVGFWHEFENCVFEAITGTGILASVPAVDLSLLVASVRDCWFNMPGVAFSSIGDGANFRIENNRMENVDAGEAAVITIDAGSGGAVERDIRISGNIIKYVGTAASNAIHVERATGAYITSNRILNGGGFAATRPGVFLGTNTAACYVRDNRTTTTFAAADGISDNGAGNFLSGNTKV
jgi:hypothetical protein